jgi:hypothetical protein
MSRDFCTGAKHGLVLREEGRGLTPLRAGSGMRVRLHGIFDCTIKGKEIGGACSRHWGITKPEADESVVVKLDGAGYEHVARRNSSHATIHAIAVKFCTRQDRHHHHVTWASHCHASDLGRSKPLSLRFCVAVHPLIHRTPQRENIIRRVPTSRPVYMKHSTKWVESPPHRGLSQKHSIIT